MLYYQGQYPEGATVAQEALTVAEKTFGPDHANVAYFLDSLASVCQAQGMYSEAGLLHNLALKIYEKVLGPDIPHMADSLTNLATTCKNIAELYRQIGKEGKAKKF